MVLLIVGVGAIALGVFLLRKRSTTFTSRAGRGLERAENAVSGVVLIGLGVLAVVGWLLGLIF